jgi:hypothetical protein
VRTNASEFGVIRRPGSSLERPRHQPRIEAAAELHAVRLHGRAGPRERQRADQRAGRLAHDCSAARTSGERTARAALADAICAIAPRRVGLVIGVFINASYSRTGEGVASGFQPEGCGCRAKSAPPIKTATR